MDLGPAFPDWLLLVFVALPFLWGALLFLIADRFYLNKKNHKSRIFVYLIILLMAPMLGLLTFSMLVDLMMYGDPLMTIQLIGRRFFS